MIYFFTFIVSIIISYKLNGIKKSSAKRVLANMRSRTNFRGYKIILKREKIQFLFYFTLTAFPVFIISALRYGIGTDYFYTYVPGFYQIANNYNNNYNNYYEPGFYLLNKVISLFTNNPQWIFVFTSLLFVYICYYSIYRMGKNIQVSIWLLLLTYVYFISYNNIRQSLASAILLLALKYLIEDDNKKFIFVVIIATTFHRSAIMFLVFLLIKKWKLSALVLNLCVLVLLLLRQFLEPLIMKIIMLNPKVASYFTTEVLQVFTRRTISNYVILLQLGIMVIFVILERIWNREQKAVFSNEWNITKWSQFFYLCICVFDGILPAAYRWARVFSFTQFILIPNALEKCDKKNNKILLYFAIILIFLLSFIKSYIMREEGVFPYVSIFSKK